MAKVKVPVYGTVGKAVIFDPGAGDRALAAVEALAQAISEGVGSTVQHSVLQGLQVGDDHPQYTMWQAGETIVGEWNFETIPLIQGETLAEYIEEVVGGSFFDFLQDTSSVVWTYHDTANELEANVPPEFVQDVVGAMVVDSTSIDFTYNDLAGTLTASTINANPTATIGLTAVNGTAATPMRSDAAPALSQAITPTWTNTHTFNNTPVVPNDSWTYAKIQNVSATSRVLGRISSGAGDIEELTGANLVTILGSAIPSGANPTASVGLSAVNGSASSFLRSDGAPALSQAIAPTWTGNHVFAPSSGNTAFTAGNVGIGVAAASVQSFNKLEVAGGRISVVANADYGFTHFSSYGANNQYFLTYNNGSTGFLFQSGRNGSATIPFLGFATADIERFRITSDGGVGLVDGITPPATLAGFALLYVDVADGDLKVKFGDGTVKTIVTD